MSGLTLALEVWVGEGEGHGQGAVSGEFVQPGAGPPVVGSHPVQVRGVGLGREHRQQCSVARTSHQGTDQGTDQGLARTLRAGAGLHRISRVNVKTGGGHERQAGYRTD